MLAFGLSGCFDQEETDKYVEDAKRLETNTAYLLQDGVVERYKARGELPSLRQQLDAASADIASFFHKNPINVQLPKQPESVMKISELGEAIHARSVEVYNALTEGRFLVANPPSGDAWDEALRHHVANAEPNRQEAAILYGGMIMGRCDRLADYLGSEFPADDLLARFERSLGFFLDDRKEEYVLIAPFNLTFGEYDFERQAFPVQSYHASDKAGALTFKKEERGTDLKVWQDDRYRCQFNDPDLEKNGLRAPKEINLSRSLLLSQAVEAIQRPIAMPPEQAERLIKDYQEAGIRTRSLLAVAYFAKPDWHSSGRLVDGDLSISGAAKLLHIEYYAYPRAFRGSLVGNLFFQTKFGRRHGLGGEFLEEDMMQLQGRFEYLPIRPPVASVSYQ